MSFLILPLPLRDYFLLLETLIVCFEMSSNSFIVPGRLSRFDDTTLGLSLGGEEPAAFLSMAPRLNVAVGSSFY